MLNLKLIKSSDLFQLTESAEHRATNEMTPLEGRFRGGTSCGKILTYFSTNHCHENCGSVLDTL